MDRSTILATVDEILNEDPVDFSRIPHVDEDDVKELVYLGMLEHYASIKELDEHLRDSTILAILIKLAIENYVLHLERMQDL